MKHYSFLNLADANSPYICELQQAAMRVVNSGRYIGGEEVEAFERELSAAVSTDYAVGVGNGLDAMRLILRAYMEMGKLHEGDEVITSSNNYIAGILAVTDCRLKPVFVEPDLATLNLDPAKIEAAVSGRTRVIMPVHLYGRISPVPEKFAREFIVMEDCAQSIGARFCGHPCGSLGSAGAFSFYPTKNIGALGDAGAVTTNNGELAECVRALRNYGSLRQYHNIYRGVNSRMDPIQAAMLRVKLPHMDEENALRRANAQAYDEELDNPLIIKPQMPADPDEHVWHQYVVRIVGGHRDEFRDFMAKNGVETAVHYPTAVHHQPCYEEYSGLHLPVAEQLAGEVVSLPVSRCTKSGDARQIARIANRFMN